ncbi:MAG TPA: FAD-binding oxidoreductase [Stellaceae bacterium]|nr:FAD-binding oxidoreductase [Stellaceae bacterium]
MEHVDVAIIGGGVIGSAIACCLAGEAGFRGSIVVIERDPSYRFAASALSLSSIRQQFSTPVNIALSQFSMAFLRRAADHLAVDDDLPDIALKERGYLFLADPAGAPRLAASHRLQQSLGADIAFLRPPELARRFPWLATDDLAAGSLGQSGEGWFDGYALLQAFRRTARSLGVRLRTGEVVGIDRAGRRICSLRLADGMPLSCGLVVNAAGPSAGKVAALAGVELPVEPRKRCVFVFASRAPLDDAPLVIDPSGVYVRPEGRSFLAGVAPPPERDPADPDFAVDDALFDEIIWPRLARRVPAFAELRRVSAWAGHYDYNSFDQNGLVGPYPGLDNFLCAAGFSGHGMQHSPGIGRGVAEWIAYGACRSLDLSALAVHRIHDNRPLREINVV